ncbi:MAG: DUF2497 domain-containing protein [Pseudomonadota bacterium]
MDEILASIRRIIHEEEETKQEIRPSGENTVVLSEERAAQAEASKDVAAGGPEAREMADLDAVAASVEAAVVPEPVITATVAVDATPDAVVLDKPTTRSDETDDAPLHVDQPFEAVSPAMLTSKRSVADRSEAQHDEQPSSAPEPQKDSPAMPATPAIKPRTDVIETETASLIGDEQSQNVSAAFASLRQHVQVTQQGGKTLEDMVAQMIQPMLKAWLNEHLPAIVERKVEEEVKRLSDR